MADRKNYSKRREEKLYAIVHDALIEIRMDMLRGKYSGLSDTGRETKFAQATATFGDKVCAEYRKSYAVKGKKGGK